MGYALYFTWADGTEDTFNVEDAHERDINLWDMLNRDKDFTYIAYCKIYASGEYGKRIVVKEG